MPLVIPVAHDFNCPWCWIMVSQVRRLRSRFDVKFEFRSYELFPDELAWPEPGPAPVPSKRPKTPSRFDLAIAAEGIPYPRISRPKQMRTHNAHEALGYARTVHGDEWPLLELLYEAYWLRGENINDLAVILRIAAPLGFDETALAEAITQRKYAHQMVSFDDDAYASGVYNVPTYWIGGQLLAEQPYFVLEAAVAEQVATQEVYPGLAFAPAPGSRPHVVINMIATIDGKTISGERDEHVMDLGSALDHQTMRALESKAQAVLIGAGTLRATPRIHYSDHLVRIVATESGKLDFSHKFFTDPGHAAVLAPSDPAGRPAEVVWIDSSRGLAQALKTIRDDLAIENLVVEGGSELNAALLTEDLVDEIFFTIAPTVKLGRDLPTIAGGNPLARADMLNFALVSTKAVGNEVFLRYQRVTNDAPAP